MEKEMKLAEAYEHLRSLGKIHTKKKFSEEIGFDKNNLSSAFNGSEQYLTDSLFRKICNKYPGIFNIDYFLKNEGEMLNSETIQEGQTYSDIERPQPVGNGLPLIPFEFVAGYGEDNKGIALNECERYYIPEFENLGAEFIVRVGGSSMYPKYSSGDLLACRKIKDILFFQWGKVYVIDSSQGQLVKRIFEHENEELITLVSDNKEKYPPHPMPKSDIRSLSIVLGVVRME